MGINYENIKPIVKTPFIMKIKDETKDFVGFSYIIAFLKTAYGINVYNGQSIQNKMLKNINGLISEYNNDYTVNKWVTEDIHKVCDPTDNDLSCDPKLIFSIKDIPLLNGKLRVKNKKVEKCGDKCGPDCKDDCFFVPMIKENSVYSKYFKDTVNNCSCIPCFDYITPDGDIKCFQKDIVPNILQILLDNFKKIYAASNDSNPRTAYYIFVDTFDNETDDVKDDIRSMVNNLQKFINKTKNPNSSDVQKECDNMNKTKNQADSSCINSKKIFCSNIDPDVPNTDTENCIKNRHTVIDVIRDNINYYLDSTISDSCYCNPVNPIDGTIITEDQIWMKRNKCKKLNDKSSNFHICNDDSFAIETLKHMKELKKKCSDDSTHEEKCSDNKVTSEIYDSYTFDFTYRGDESINNCKSLGGDSDCYIYKNDKSIEQDLKNTDKEDTVDEKKKDFDYLIDDVKDESFYKYASMDYCYCHQSEDTNAKCNTFETCFETGASHSPTNVASKSCSEVHEDVFGESGKLTREMSDIDKNLAKDNIISRDICENKLRCLGYKCENGGQDNSKNSRYTNNDSYSSYARSFFSPLTPEYTGLSLNHTLWDQITIPLNSNDQNIDVSTKPIMEVLTGEKQTLTSYINKQKCDAGNVINQYANIDAKMAKNETKAMVEERQSMSQIFNVSNYTGCIGGEVSNSISSIGDGLLNPLIEVANKVPLVNIKKVSSSSLRTPPGCKNLGEGYSKFLSNIYDLTGNFIDRTENQIVSGILSSVGNALSKCPTEDDNKGINFDYSEFLGYLSFIVFTFMMFFAIPVVGPFIILILILELIFFKIYDLIFSTKKNIENVINDDDNKDAGKFTLGVLVLILCVYILKRTSYGRIFNKKGLDYLKKSYKYEGHKELLEKK